MALKRHNNLTILCSVILPTRLLTPAYISELVQVCVYVCVCEVRMHVYI